MGQHRRSFTPEFKQEAVDLCRRSGKSECQVARELGIPQPTFNRPSSIDVLPRSLSFLLLCRRTGSGAAEFRWQFRLLVHAGRIELGLRQA